MKIHHSRGRPTQYGFTRVTCLDAIIVEMINCAPNANACMNKEYIYNIRANAGGAIGNNSVYNFFHGAVLVAGIENNEFFIKCFALDGSDCLAAIEELKMLDAFRIGLNYFQAMKEVRFDQRLEVLNLKVVSY